MELCRITRKLHLGLAKAGLNSRLVLFSSGLNSGVVLFSSGLNIGILLYLSCAQGKCNKQMDKQSKLTHRISKLLQKGRQVTSAKMWVFLYTQFQRWKIFLDQFSPPFETEICLGQQNLLNRLMDSHFF